MKKQLGRAWIGVLAWALLLTAAAIYPFKPGYGGPRRTSDGATIAADGTLHFDGPSFVRSEEPPLWLQEALIAEELTIAFEAKSARPDQHGPARLVTLSSGAYQRNFTLAQKGVDLVVRVRREASDENGAPPLKIADVFGEPAWTKFEVRFSTTLIEVLIDGNPRYRDVQESSPFALWDPTCTFAIGDEVNGARGWDGELRGLTLRVDDQVFDPLARGTMKIPETLLHVPETARRLLRFDPSHALLVALIHFLAFLPLGVLLALTGKVGVLRAGLYGLAFGALVQLVKLFFIGRHPSLYHALPNGLGALVGAWAISFRYRQRP